MKARRIIAIDRDPKLLKRLKDEMIELGYTLTVFEFTSIEACYRSLFPELATVQEVKGGAAAKPGEKPKTPAPPTYRLILTRELAFAADKDLKIQIPGVLWDHAIPAAVAPETWAKILAPVDLENMKRMVNTAIDTNKVHHLLVDVRLASGKSDWVEFRIAPFQAKQALVEVHVPSKPKEAEPSKAAATAAEPAAAGAAPVAKAAAPGAKPDDNAGYDLIVVDTDLVKDPVEWIKKMRAFLAEKKLLVGASGQSTQFLLTGFENAKFDSRKFRNECIQDFVFKPFDWPIICQKIGLVLSEKQEPPKGLLFDMKVNKLIDLAKDVHIEQISEFGWVGWNPVPLKDGTVVSFFSPQTALGRADESIMGQVYKCERHPVRPEVFRIYYSFAGLKHTQVAALRNQYRKFKQELRINPAARQKPANKAPKVKEDPLEKLMKKEAPPGRGLIVDFDRDTLEIFKDAAKSVRESGLELMWYSSLSPLLRMLNVSDSKNPKAQKGNAAAPAKPQAAPPANAPVAAKEPEQPAAPAPVSTDEFDLSLAVATSEAEAAGVPIPVNAWAWAEKPVLSLEVGTGRLLEVEPEADPEGLFFGKPIQESIGQPVHESSWAHSDDAEFFQDFVTQSFARKKAETCFRYTNPEGKEFWIRVQNEPSEVGAVSASTWSFAEAKPEEVQDYLNRTGQQPGQNAAIEKLDFVAIDAGLLPEDPAPMLRNLKEALVKSGASKHGDQIPIIVLGEDRSLTNLDSILAGGASEILLKPVDRTLLVSKLSLRLGLLEPKTIVQMPDMVPCEIDAFVAKKVKLATLSEFGVSIVTTTKLRPGTFLRFFAPMLMDDKGFGVLGRCYKVEEIKDPKSPGYISYFSFFAVTDIFQKPIRNYIRETYAGTKAEAMNE